MPGASSYIPEGTAVTAVPDVTLNNGRTIPQFGFGVFQIRPADTAAAVATALEAGYRHIDTAEMYGNEKEVGTAIAKSGLDRADVFVTSKLNNGFHRPDDARRAFAESRSEEHTSELQSRPHLVCRLLLEKKKKHHFHSRPFIQKKNKKIT